MKKIVLFFVSVVTIVAVMSGCMVVPDNSTLGNPKEFEKDGIKLLLTDEFEEKRSEVGFDAYYESDFCGVVVLKESFSLEEGLEERPLSEYTENVMTNNGHSDSDVIEEDRFYYYIYERGGTKGYSCCYKGTDAFWIVQFMCRTSDAAMLEDTIKLWAQAVEVE
ncbi:MAG: hypothetical protein IJP10_00480 [Clostridia bacterium]|nr:hypothetical protein [Clostridia bacterium]